MYQDRIRTTRNSAEVRAGKREWFRFENKAGADLTSIYIYDEISWFGVTAQDFMRELGSVRSSSIDLHVSSPGGDVFDGIAIYNALKQHPATVNVTIDSIAASIASVIAMAGDTIAMAQGSMIMIHEPFAMVIGDSRDMRKQADALDLMGNSIAGIYAARAGGSVDSWRAVMADETWYGDADAVASGLADSVTGTAAAKNVFDLSIFRNGPGTQPAAEPERQKAAAPDTSWRTNARFAIANAELRSA